MKMDPSSLKFLKTVAEVATKLDIDKLLFDVETNQVRALHPDRTVAIINEIPDYCKYDFNQMGIYRLRTFLARMNLMGDQFTTSIKLDSEQNVQQLIFNKETLNVEYRCASPSIIKAPKKISDIFVCSFQINEETIHHAQQVATAMLDSSVKDQTISICNTDDDEISFLINDTVHDTTEFIVSSEYKILNDKFQPSFIFKYPIKLLMTFLRQPQFNSELKEFKLGQRGMLQSKIQGIDVFLLPRV